MMRVLEVCAGAGGMALGLEMAGFEHVALVEVNSWARATLRANRPSWPVVDHQDPGGLGPDLRCCQATAYHGIDLLAGGLPCPPFSAAGKRLGPEDDRDLFPHLLRLAAECEPRAILVENVPGLLAPRFAQYRYQIERALADLGYTVSWAVLDASRFGVPQRRRRVVLAALRGAIAGENGWPWPDGVEREVTVGEALRDDMAAGGWEGAGEWAALANRPAPVIVGGSRLHGGADLGPSRTRRAWEALGIDGSSLADGPPGPGFAGRPRLTLAMAALIQGFPRGWAFAGSKTEVYRQIGNAMPPALSQAVGQMIAALLQEQRCR